MQYSHTLCTYPLLWLFSGDQSQDNQYFYFSFHMVSVGSYVGGWEHGLVGGGFTQDSTVETIKTRALHDPSDYSHLAPANRAFPTSCIFRACKRRRRAPCLSGLPLPIMLTPHVTYFARVQVEETRAMYERQATEFAESMQMLAMQVDADANIE